jgi:hypothetical protein
MRERFNMNFVAQVDQQIRFNFGALGGRDPNTKRVWCRRGFLIKCCPPNSIETADGIMFGMKSPTLSVKGNTSK